MDGKGTEGLGVVVEYGSERGRVGVTEVSFTQATGETCLKFWIPPKRVYSEAGQGVPRPVRPGLGNSDPVSRSGGPGRTECPRRRRNDRQ